MTPSPAAAHTILDLGCGASKQAGSFGLDALALPGVDLVHNLDSMPWPLPSSHFEEVRAMDILEHVEDFVGAVVECHRVLRPGGLLKVQMPFASGVNRHTDPTHRRGATSRTFDYFVQGKMYHELYKYTDTLFRSVTFRYERGPGTSSVFGWPLKLAGRLLMPVAQRYADVYEHNFMGVYPVHAVIFELVKL